MGQMSKDLRLLILEWFSWSTVGFEEDRKEKNQEGVIHRKTVEELKHARCT
jgi:hypothetical protein